ncbi:MAG: hypothetical protein IJB98_02950, partial [Clostridia bacterium]|nr:hypothetical protein [Clostridia bacterium]
MKKIKNIIISIFLFVIVSCSGLAFFNVSLFSGASSIAEVEKGGAVYLQNDATYTMKGGSIKNKTATYGGAVYESDGTVFNMQGGEISGNLADY